jgi:hypothetical protein
MAQHQKIPGENGNISKWIIEIQDELRDGTHPMDIRDLLYLESRRNE